MFLTYKNYYLGITADFMKNKYIKYFMIMFVVWLGLQSKVQATQLVVNGVRLNKNITPLREMKRENVITQSLDFSCGAAGLSTLLNFYLEDNVSEKEVIANLLQIVPLDKVRERRGFSLYDLKVFAQQKGYKVTGYKMDMDFLKELHRPVLVPVKFKNYRHFIVVKGIIADRVFIADPAAGNISMKITQFAKMWTDGIGLVIEHQDEKATGEGLGITREDFILADYKHVRRLVNQGIVSTTFYPNEWQ